jgi:phosphoglycolate phosphatase
VRPTILLYDVDGTLISAAGVGRRALEAAFHRRFGRRGMFDFAFDGMTDPAIVAVGLRAAGVEEGALARETEAMLAAYLTQLAAHCATAEVRIHAGVADALAASADRSGFAVGLGTGNVAQGARLKLQRVGLEAHFAFGGFGDDSADRPTLLRIGASRGAATLGVPLADCRLVVIGDTPKDIAAAQAIGAESIAVATGSFSVEALRPLAPTHAFASLAQKGALEAVLGP